VVALPGFLYRNLAAGLTPTATSSTTATGLGWDRLNDPQPRKRARVAATSAILVFDLGSAQSVDTWFLGSTTLPAAATVRVRASTTDPTCVASLLLDTGVQSSVTDPEYVGNVVACFASTSARYWRIDIASATNPIDIGISSLGLLFRPVISFDYGAQEGRLDLSARDRNPDTGAAYGLTLPKPKVRLLTFANLSQAEVRNLTTSFDDMDRYVGASGDVLFVEDSDATWAERARDSVYGSYRETAGSVLASRMQLDRWSRTFRMEQRL